MRAEGVVWTSVYSNLCKTDTIAIATKVGPTTNTSTPNTQRNEGDGETWFGRKMPRVRYVAPCFSHSHSWVPIQVLTTVSVEAGEREKLQGS